MQSTIEISSNVRLREPVIEVTGSLFRFMLGSKVNIKLKAGRTTVEREIILDNTRGFKVAIDRRGLSDGPYVVVVQATDAFGVQHEAVTEGVLRSEGKVVVSGAFERDNKIVMALKTKNLPNKIQPIVLVMKDRHKRIFRATYYHNPFLDGEFIVDKPDGLSGLTTIVFSVMDWRSTPVHTEVKVTL